MKYIVRWAIFIKERFNPAAYFFMILTFFTAHFLTYERDFDLGSFIHFVPLFIAIFLLFFRFRIFDEIKDGESDKINFPNRPLPRGLLKKEDLLYMARIIIVIELAVFSYYGIDVLFSGIVMLLYSLLMYKEFFLGKWLKAHLTTYALTHTVIATFISITIFTALTGKSVLMMSLDFVLFSLGSWFLFNVFEFGRKTFASREEKPGIDSYSNIFGRYGAILLVILMMFMATKLVSVRMAVTHVKMLYFCNIVLLFSGVIYAVGDKRAFAKAYRNLSSVYIVLIYGALIVSNLLAKF